MTARRAKRTPPKPAHVQRAEKTDLTMRIMIRTMPAENWALIRRGAQVRGLTIGEYIARLQRVHDLARHVADGGADLKDLQDGLGELDMPTFTEGA